MTSSLAPRSIYFHQNSFRDVCASRYSGSFSGDADASHAENAPQTQLLAGRSPERRSSPERYALLAKVAIMSLYFSV